MSTGDKKPFGKVLAVNKTYVFFIPPGWLLGGTIDSMTDDVVALRDCTYLETAGENQSIIGGVTTASTPEQLHAACKRAWGLPDGTLIRTEAILIATPCVRDLTPLARSEDAAALRRMK